VREINMREIRVKKYIRYFFWIAILTFVLNKLLIRPWILENDLPGFFVIITYSLPNLIEAIVGTLILTGILLQARQYFNKADTLNITLTQLLAVSVAAIYVISQELKFHNLGGNNIYDPYDLIASIIGLVVTFTIIQLFGFTEAKQDLND